MYKLLKHDCQRIVRYYPLLLLAVLCEGIPSFAQEHVNEIAPHGNPFAKVFFDFNTKINQGKGASAFEIQRANLGYNYQFSKEVSFTVNTDVGNPNSGDFKYTVYLKNAYVRYNSGGWNIDLGLIGTRNFKVQEDFWGYRFIEKSPQDLYKMSTSADLGVVLSRSFSDKIAADLTVRNGEGYKSLQMDNYFYYGAGLTVSPDQQTIFRLFYEAAPEQLTRSSVSAFAGHNWNKVRIGLEFVKDFREKFIDKENLSCLSTFIAFRISPSFELFARYDDLSSASHIQVYIPGVIGHDLASDQAWNVANDGGQAFTGIEYSPIKGVKTSLNFRSWKPADESKALTSSVYANFEFSFK